MRRMLVLQSGTRGVLYVNGCFCGPVEPGGQAFPMGQDAQIYIQLFPFEPGQGAITAALELRAGRIERLEPQACCYLLIWPDGVFQLELRTPGQQDIAHGAADGGDLLFHYLELLRTGDARAQELLSAPGVQAELGAYEAVLPLRFAPLGAPGGYELRAGILRRLGENVAQVDAVLASAGQDALGRPRITRLMLVPTA